MTYDEIIGFSITSAENAIANYRDYLDLEDSIGSNRDNIRETLKEYDAVEHEADAWAAFDAKVAELLGK